MASNNNPQVNQIPGPCPPTTTVTLTPLTAVNTTTTVGPTATRVKIPVVLAEPTLQIPVEAIITLAGTGATEIKRVTKNVFLTQVKLVPVAPFTRIDTTDYFTVSTAKLFVAGHIRKDIEYTTAAAPGVGCTTALTDQIVDIPFSGFTELSTAAGTLLNLPILGVNETSTSSFLSDANNLNARLDKFFFNNLVKYNEQPFGELVAADFFELDFSLTEPAPEGAFTTLTEKIVLDLTVKVLQTQQLTVALPTVVPVLPVIPTPPTTTATTTSASS